jgi:hypothetical protein
MNAAIFPCIRGTTMGSNFSAIGGTPAARAAAAAGYRAATSSLKETYNATTIWMPFPNVLRICVAMRLSNDCNCRIIDSGYKISPRTSISLLCLVAQFHSDAVAPATDATATTSRKNVTAISTSSATTSLLPTLADEGRGMSRGRCWSCPPYTAERRHVS